MANQRVFYFGKTKQEGSADMKELLGGKGANLSEMTRIGVPVPPGFTITTETCGEYYDNDRRTEQPTVGCRPRQLALSGL